MKLVPQLNSTGEIEDGSYIRALDFCQRNCNKGRCKTFYNGSGDCGAGRTFWRIKAKVEIWNDTFPQNEKTEETNGKRL